MGFLLHLAAERNIRPKQKYCLNQMGKKSATSGLLGQFGNLSNLAGIDLGNIGGTDAVRPELYPEIIREYTLPVENYEGKS